VKRGLIAGKIGKKPERIAFKQFIFNKLFYGIMDFEMTDVAIFAVCTMGKNIIESFFRQI